MEAKRHESVGLDCLGVALEHHTKIRSVTTTIEAWNTLREFHNRTTTHYRVSMTRRLHDLMMEDGETMAKSLDQFNELIVALQTLMEILDDPRQLMILLSSRLVEYEMLSTIIEI